MAVNNTGGCRRRRAAQAAVPELPPVPQEPVMHRWPHPAGTEAPSEPAEAELHAIGCALTRQTQLLTEIRALLERLAEQIAGSGLAKVVITGVEKKNHVANLCFKRRELTKEFSTTVIAVLVECPLTFCVRKVSTVFSIIFKEIPCFIIFRII